jgi:hypothetical protein
MGRPEIEAIMDRDDRGDLERETFAPPAPGNAGSQPNVESKHTRTQTNDNQRPMEILNPHSHRLNPVKPPIV